MNLRQKVALISILERNCRLIFEEYKRQRLSAKEQRALIDYFGSDRLSDSCLPFERAYSELNGACLVLGLSFCYNKENERIEIRNSKDKVILWTNGCDSSYDLDLLAMKYYEKYGY